ncbi:jg2694 [Pararge aegeria aegeria]|uniref:Jg2694 protein n=1 Tax=Pararge aegeria aegeria TaxID=348720 RepID=A0A8S4QHM4_9NEOP|nr:jg2694 [Pararge aegeria aegeria]
MAKRLPKFAKIFSAFPLRTTALSVAPERSSKSHFLKHSAILRLDMWSQLAGVTQRGAASVAPGTINITGQPSTETGPETEEEALVSQLNVTVNL